MGIEDLQLFPVALLHEVFQEMANTGGTFSSTDAVSMKQLLFTEHVKCRERFCLFC